MSVPDDPPPSLTPPTPPPPRFWSALVERLLDAADAEAILGDLEEEYREVVRPRRGRRAADRWYRRMAADSIVRRWRRGRRRRLRPLSPLAPNPGTAMDALAHDLRFGLRSLWRRKGFTAAVVATLALAVGVNTAMFALVDGVLLEPLPHPQPDELVTLWQASVERPDARGAVSIPNFDDWRARSSTVESMASVRATTLTVSGLGDPRVLPAALVSDGYFEVFGASPVLGRGIALAEARPGGPDAVVLSHGLWTAAFAADPDVVGSGLTIEGSTYTVVGVAPEGFDRPGGARLWIGEVIDPARCGRTCVNFQVVGRLRDGVSVEAAMAEFDAIGGAMAEEHGMEGFRVNLVPLRTVEVGHVGPALWLLLGAVGLVLLIACANIANLLLVSASERSSEMAVRAALGAGRARIVEQLMSEAALLALAGGALGLAVARVGLEAALALPGLELPRSEAVGLDGTVLLFTAGAVVAALFLFGLAPAVSLARRPLVTRTRGSGRRVRAHAALVATQVGLSVVLFLGTALLVRTIAHVRAVDLGFEAEGVGILALSVPPGEVPDPEEAIRLHADFRAELETLPGVASVGAAFGAPLSSINVFSSVEVDGWSEPEPPPNSGVRSITPGYLETLGIPLLAGRAPSSGDVNGSERVAWINETAARSWFGAADPIGRTIDLSASAGLPEADPRTIVGVVADTRFSGPREPAPLEVYVPHAQNGVRYLEYFVATRPGAPPVAAAAREVMETLGPRLPVQDVGTLRARLGAAEAETRLWAALLGSFAGLALGLAALGLFGTVAYQVSMRKREIGLRMAVGAAGGRVVALLLRQGLVPALGGLAVGLVLAFAAARLLEGLLFGVGPGDPLAWLGASAILLAVIVIASLIPSLRAVRIDPAVTLRAE